MTDMTYDEARELIRMEKAQQPLYWGPAENGRPEPVEFTCMRSRGLWQRDGDGYRPTHQALIVARKIVANPPPPDKPRFCPACGQRLRRSPSTSGGKQ